DLVLQSGHERHAHQRGIAKRALDSVVKLRACRFAVPLCAQLLELPFAAEIVDQRTFLRGRVPPNNRKVFPYRSMREKLPDERLAVHLAFGEKQNTRGKPVNTVHHISALPLRLKVRDKKRQG